MDTTPVIRIYATAGSPSEPLIELTLTERDWRRLARSMEVFFEGFNSWPLPVQNEFSSLYGFFVGEFMIDEDGPAPDFTPRQLEQFADRTLTQADYQPIVDELIERSGGPEQFLLDIQREITDPTNQRGAEVRKELQSLIPTDFTRLVTIETDFFLWGFFLGASSSIAAFYTNSPHTQPLWDVLTRLNPSLLDAPRPDSMPNQLALELRELTQSLWTQGMREVNKWKSRR